MSAGNMDKIVKLACKPKNAPPKPKYVDVLVAATYSDDGSMNDVIRSLALRLREPNTVVVFKALLTLHQMIRSGSTDQLMEVLSASDVLRLRNVNAQNWEGYSPPASMTNYARYLDARIRVFRDLKHDLVRVQAESNRRSDGQGAASKARRLRHLGVEKGLLREVKGVQNVLDALVQCKFYDDDLRDENTVLAFRMLVKDLLVLFQAGNEGVCNILEHYFEMSKIDATDSFDIYKSFISQTDKVVDYLGLARKLHNIVNVPVPNLKHAPTGLVKALEEYLHDPNFESNRREYRKSLGVVEGRKTSPSPTREPVAKVESSSSTKASAPAPVPTTTATSSAPSSAPAPSQKIQDFFDSIQADQQPTMFGGPAQQINYSQVVPTFNPFRQSMMMPQQTGFMQPQMTGFGMPPQQQPFLQPQATGVMAFGQQPFQQQPPFIQPQPTSFIQPQPTSFIQPQATGANPFRQSMLLNTSHNAPGPSGAFSQPSSPFQPNNPQSPFSQIQRPGSTPLENATAKPLIAQPTGSKNPFAPAGGVPSASMSKVSQRGPSMNELMFAQQNSAFGQSNAFGQNTGAATSSPWGTLNGNSGSGTTGSNGNLGGSGISDVASSFAFDGSKSQTVNNGNDFLSQFGSLSVNTNGNNNNANTISSPVSPLSVGPPNWNSLNSASGPSSPGGGFLQPQQTGFGGSAIKPFKPTSSFGSQLVSGLGSISEGGGGEPTSSGGNGGVNQFGAFGGLGSTNTGTSTLTGTGTGTIGSQSTGFSSGLNTQSTGFTSTMGTQSTGLSQQNQGQPQANPFRSTMFGSISNGSNPNPNLNTASPGLSGMTSGGGAFGANSPFAGQNSMFGQNQPLGTGPNSQFGQFGQFGSGGGSFGGSGATGMGQRKEGGSLI